VATSTKTLNYGSITELCVVLTGKESQVQKTVLTDSSSGKTTIVDSKVIDKDCDAPVSFVHVIPETAIVEAIQNVDEIK